MRASLKWGLPVVALLFAAVPAAVQAQAAPALPTGVTQAMVDQGKTIFAGAGNCHACHGAEGAGTAFAPKLNDKEWLNIDGSYDAIVKIVTDGVPMPKQSMMQMQPKGGSQINADQVKAVAAYVWRLSNGM
jgi:mono/diheme cytochrome c family protein